MKTFFWVANSKTATVYLFGSIHVGRDDMYPFPKKITKAFESSKYIVMEADIRGENKRKLQRLVAKLGMYKSGKNIENDISPEVKKMLKAYCQKRGIAFFQLKGLKPWLVALQVNMIEMQFLGFRADLGVENYFMQKLANKKFLALESVESQLKIFANSSKRLQNAYLKDTLKRVPEAKETLEKLVKAWKEGDGKTLETLILKTQEETPELKNIYKKLFDDRNIKMTQKIEEYLKTKSTYFVIVGSGHLVGETGILKLLKKKGFTLSRK